jgi:hypothetical protein
MKTSIGLRSKLPDEAPHLVTGRAFAGVPEAYTHPIRVFTIATSFATKKTSARTAASAVSAADLYREPPDRERNRDATRNDGYKLRRYRPADAKGSRN